MSLDPFHQISKVLVKILILCERPSLEPWSRYRYCRLQRATHLYCYLHLILYTVMLNTLWSFKKIHKKRELPVYEKLYYHLHLILCTLFLLHTLKSKKIKSYLNINLLIYETKRIPSPSFLPSFFILLYTLKLKYSKLLPKDRSTKSPKKILICSLCLIYFNLLPFVFNLVM